MGQPDKSFWVKDEYVLKCTSCSTPFSISVRRHHCRACGEVFCGDCTTKSIPLPDLGYPQGKPQRVCEHCYTVRIVSSLDSNGKFTTSAATLDQIANGQTLSSASTTVTSTNSSASEEQQQSSYKFDDSSFTQTNDKDAVRSQILDGLKRLYRAGIKPLEVCFKFNDFYSPILTDADFDSKPMILLIGQYSVGKTSFIRHLLQRDFPGMRVGPEPTTDRFVIVSQGEHDAIIPGNALAVQASRPFRSLQKFGAAFLNKLECAEVKSLPKDENGVIPGSILSKVNFVDTPGVLSGEKQRIGRSYDFTSVVEWFAGRCDRILLLFDAHKLDLSDEFTSAMGALRGHDEKIRVVLNKADTVDAQQLMRVHGALMWSLGKVIRTPEVVRVYVGSFWDEPLQNKQFEELFTKERQDLLADLETLPDSSVMRKVSEIAKRARAAKTHAIILDHLRNKLPYFGKESALKKMLENLPIEFHEISRMKGIPLGDFPSPEHFKYLVETHCSKDLSELPELNQSMITETTEILSSYIPRLVSKYQKATSNFSN